MARLDFAGALLRVMARGFQRRAIFRDGRDREAFVARILGISQPAAEATDRP